MLHASVLSARTAGLALACSLALLASGCTTLQQTQQRADVLDFLYPPGAVPAPASDVHLDLPLRVGVAFAPLSNSSSSSSSSMTEPYFGGTYAPGLPVERQQALLERVVAAFRDTPGVAEIEAIPAQYLRPGGGFENVDQLRALFGIDLFALVSYDQVQYHDYNLSSLTYLTVVGAYVIEGDDAQTHTFVDVSVFDVPSRCMLFNAAGRSRREEESTAFEFGRSMRDDAYGGFDEAMKGSLAQLQLALDGFREQAKSGTVRGVGSPNLTVTGQGAGALDPATLLLVLAGAGAAWNARRKHARLAAGRTGILAPRSKRWSLPLLVLACFGAVADAGGTLKAKGSPDQAIQILDHRVAVSIVDGFARTEVNQTFFNPNARDLEALYSFPVPESASLSEMTIFAGETRLDGEVVAADEAERIYAEERDSGNDAGLARRDSYRTFEFLVARVPAQGEASFRFVYYQPLELDTGVGRYVYPLEDGGTDDLARAFWEKDEIAQRSFAFHLELSSTWPVEDVRLPGLEALAVVQEIDAGCWQADVDVQGAHPLTRDVVFYYRLQEGLPGRIELVPYRASTDAPGTFMLVVTPGIDLAPLVNGADYVFVLDVSGSMQGKLQTLADGVARALGTLQPKDRFRVVTFCDRARELVPWCAATADNVRQALNGLEGLSSQGGTDLYAGLKLGLAKLDDDRATSVVLVTDAVANLGETSPQRFAELMKTVDLRVFGFLLGNSANWPLMRAIADASGGFYAAVSNADDIQGQLVLAKQKVTHEALHDARLSFSGVRVHDVSTLRSKIYHGQQLVFFGRYAEPGPLEIRLAARLTGEDKVYTTTALLPPLDTEHPELERLWAMDQVEAIELQRDLGKLPERECKDAIAHLGAAYQLVTDETSMIVLADDAFQRRGIERKNVERTEREHREQARRVGVSRPSYRVDAGAPAFPSTAASPGSGGGAFDLATLLLVLGGAGTAWSSRRVRVRDSA